MFTESGNCLEQRADFELIETVLWKPEGNYYLLERHLDRLHHAASFWGFPYNRQHILNEFNELKKNFNRAHRVRLTLSAEGVLELQASPLFGLGTGQWRLRLSAHTVDPDNPFQRFKTTKRELYDQERRIFCNSKGIDEVIFLNKRGELVEGAITNIFIERGGKLLTPPLNSGPLPGVLRAEMLENGAAEEALLMEADLIDAKIYVGNSVRGLVEGVF